MTTTPHAAEERAKVCALLRSLAQEQDEVGHPFAAGVYRECADELERAQQGAGPMPVPTYGVWKHRPGAGVWCLRDAGSADHTTELATVGDSAFRGCTISSHPQFDVVCRDVAAFVAWLSRGGCP